MKGDVTAVGCCRPSAPNALQTPSSDYSPGVLMGRLPHLHDLGSHRNPVEYRVRLARGGILVRDTWIHVDGLNKLRRHIQATMQPIGVTVSGEL